ncbi:hypothetical protein BSNK01_12480 [Bacillaceae bacterium]
MYGSSKNLRVWFFAEDDPICLEERINETFCGEEVDIIDIKYRTTNYTTGNGRDEILFSAMVVYQTK